MGGGWRWVEQTGSTGGVGYCMLPALPSQVPFSLPILFLAWSDAAHTTARTSPLPSSPTCPLPAHLPAVPSFSLPTYVFALFFLPAHLPGPFCNVNLIF